MLKTFETYYLQKDYQQAIQTLQQQGQGLPAGIKHFNLGTVYAETEQWPRARFHLIQAERAGYTHEKLVHNLLLVESKLEIDRWEKPLTGKDYFIQLSSFFSGGPMISLSLIFLIWGLLILKKKRQLWIAGVFLLLFTMPLAFNLWVNSWPWALVMEPATIQEGPSAIFGNRGDIPAGVLILSRQDGDWARITYPARFEGWVRQRSIKNLEQNL